MDRRAFHGQLDGHGHRLPGHEPGLRQPLGRRRGRDARAGRHRRRSGPRASTSSSTCRRTSPTALALGFRNAEFITNMGFKLKNDAEAYGFPNFVKEMFFDSETSMIVISGVPGKEINRGADGKVLEGAARTPGVERQGPAELGDVGAQEGDQRPGRLPAGPVPGQLRPEPLLGHARPTRRTRPPCSSRWSARSRPTASTPGSGTATPTPAAPATASSSTTRS